MVMDLVYLSSPYRGDTETNEANARKYCKQIAKQVAIPIAPHFIFTQFLDDNNEQERNLGIQMGLELLKYCDEMWVVSNTLTEGMKLEIKQAQEIVLKIRFFNQEMEEIKYEAVEIDDRLSEELKSAIRNIRSNCY